MKKIVLSLFILMCATSCGTSSLYYWGGSSFQGVSEYEALSYQRANTENPKVICNIIEMYEDMLAHPGGLRQVPPPGICAEYAYMLLQPAIMDIFDKNATKAQRDSFNNSMYGNDPSSKAVKLLEKEVELYPESLQIVSPLLKRLTGK